MQSHILKHVRIHVGYHTVEIIRLTQELHSTMTDQLELERRIVVVMVGWTQMGLIT